MLNEVDFLDNGQVTYQGNKILHKYIKDKQGRKIGLCVAFHIDGEIRYGFSQTNVKKGDKFRHDLAFQVAIGRAERHPEISLPFDKYFTICNKNPIRIITHNIPAQARNVLESLYYRSQNYFKYIKENK